jgi:cobalt-zinc-cadmium efflux system outer membrane protein
LRLRLHSGLSVPHLSELLAEAARNNPDIAASMRAWRAAAQVPTQVSTLPDRQVAVQHVAVGSPRPFAGYSNSEFAYIGFGISQDIPYPGKLSLKAEAAQRDAAVTREKFEAAKRNVFEQVKANYFQIAYLQKTLGVLERDQTLLDQIEKIAEARYRVGQGNQQDVLKAQLQKTKTERAGPSPRTDGQPAGPDEQDPQPGSRYRRR